MEVSPRGSFSPHTFAAPGRAVKGGSQAVAAQPLTAPRNTTVSAGIACGPTALLYTGEVL